MRQEDAAKVLSTRTPPEHTNRKADIMSSIRKTIAGTFLAGGLLLGAPVLATLAAAPASADNGGIIVNDDGILIHDGHQRGVELGEDLVIVGLGHDQGVQFDNDGVKARVGGLEVNLED
jgi:hypothetical protein